MKVQIQIEKDCTETQVIIITKALSASIQELASRIEKEPLSVLTGIQDEKHVLIKSEEIFRIYADHGKVWIQTKKGLFQIRKTLYQIEELLDEKQFIRISHSEIISLSKIVNFDLSFNGTICVNCIDGSKSYVSRRYVPKIKKILGV